MNTNRMKFVLVLVACGVVASAQTMPKCGYAAVEPLSQAELNSDGSISGRGVVHNTQGIVNGDTAKTNSIPWQVMLHANGGLCGGTILSRDWVLTAAHCITSTVGGKYKMFFGLHDTKGSHMTRITCLASTVMAHAGYNDKTMANDIALLKVDHASCSKTLVFSPAIQPICLPTKTDMFSTPNVFAMVSGWGTTSEGGATARFLQKTVVQMHSNEECNKLYSPYGGVAKGSLCASGVNSKGNTDSCQGDSGGPLVVRTKDHTWKLAGVVSWGMGCAAKNAPGVYADVASFVDWIEERTGLAAGAEGGVVVMPSSTTMAPPVVMPSSTTMAPPVACSAARLEVGITLFTTKGACSVMKQVPSYVQRVLKRYTAYISGMETKNGCFKVSIKARRHWTGTPRVVSIRLYKRC